MRTIILLLALCLLGPLPAPGHAQATAPAAPGTVAAPAHASSRAAPERPSLEQIHNFTRVYEIIRQAYVKPVDNPDLMQAAISGMLAKLDPHSAYLDQEGMEQLRHDTSGQYSGLGVVVTSLNGRLTVVSPIDGSPAAKAGIKSGDVIVQIDGKPVDSSNVNASIDKLRGKAGSKITLVIVHAGAAVPSTKTLTRALIAMTSVHIRPLPAHLAYIRISQFQAHTARDLKRDLAAFIQQHGQPAGAVLDLRANPGGLVQAAVGVADTFLDGGLVVSTRGRVSAANHQFRAQPGDLLHGAPLVVLVNEGTASAAEIVSGALKDNQRALIMGRRTFGKGVVQTIIPVDKTHMLKLTTARYFTPNGTSIQAEGITPDIVIPDLMAQKGSTMPSLVESESDLPHHLGNTDPDAVKANIQAAHAALASSTKLAQDDYALAQAVNVLKGMALTRAAAAAPAAASHADADVKDGATAKP